MIFKLGGSKFKCSGNYLTCLTGSAPLDINTGQFELTSSWTRKKEEWFPWKVKWNRIYDLHIYTAHKEKRRVSYPVKLQTYALPNPEKHQTRQCRNEHVKNQKMKVYELQNVKTLMIPWFLLYLSSLFWR